MKEELVAYQQNKGHETLVSCPACANIIGFGWIHHTKYQEDGSIDRFKA